MKTYELPAETKAAKGYTHKVVITHDDLTDADAAQIVSQETNPSGTVVSYRANPSATPFVFVAGTAASPKYIQAQVDTTAAKSLADHNVGEIHFFLRIADLTEL